MKTQIVLGKTDDGYNLNHGGSVAQSDAFGVLAILGALLGNGLTTLDEGECLILNFEKI